MSAVDISVAANDAMLAGFASLLGTGVAPAYALIYGGVRPAPSGTTSESALATLVFSLPAATIVDHVLVFAQGESSGDLVMLEGNATWARIMVDSNWVLDADVTGPDGAGPLKIVGADPSNPTRLFAGARVLLDNLTMA